MKYVFDTGEFINIFRHYYRDQFPSFWEQFDLREDKSENTLSAIEQRNHSQYFAARRSYAARLRWGPCPRVGAIRALHATVRGIASVAFTPALRLTRGILVDVSNRPGLPDREL